MAENKVVIALDFDGLIADSIRDSFVQSVNAYNSMGGRFPRIRATEKKFQQGKPFAKNADGYYTLLRLIEQNPKVNFRKMTQEQFDREFERDRTEKGPKFEKRFSEYRRHMQREHPDEWIALNSIFPRVERQIGKLQKKYSVWIATGKDRESVVRLLKKSGINIPADQILSKENTKSKVEQMRIIAEREGVPVSKILMIDDSLNYLRDVKAVGAEAAMAKWGYSTREQRRQAKREGIPLIRRPLFGWSFTLAKKLRQMRKK
ncbi:MAG: HAD family hydrolase [Candidatus Diapherotrites archaeon]